ncbi:SAM-dependent methyltransferase [Desulfitispora alkaliphila]|uniref:class I SAM-dependent methyltransferase n=1 Tax=Desulfitispora alkaliphila TaxID=622674 RepID=UPI003D2206C6
MFKIENNPNQYPYWEQVWKQAKESSLFKDNDKDVVGFWNRRAENFKKNTTGKQGEKRVNKIITWLRSEGVELVGSKILDIGAGPGSFAIPLAKECQTVTALEPSSRMIELMEQYAADNKLTNIETIEDKWEEEMDIDKYNLRGSYDIVFSSMNPGINDAETLEKALACATKYCYISSFAGRRDSPALIELWPEVYQEEMPPWPGDIFYIVNYLYTRGYQLSFKVWEESNPDIMKREDAITILTDMLSRFGGKEREEVEKIVTKYVDSKCTSGELRQTVTTRLGKVLVKL